MICKQELVSFRVAIEVSVRAARTNSVSRQISIADLPFFFLAHGTDFRPHTEPISKGGASAGKVSLFWYDSVVC